MFFQREKSLSRNCHSRILAKMGCSGSSQVDQIVDSLATSGNGKSTFIVSVRNTHSMDRVDGRWVWSARPDCACCAKYQLKSTFYACGGAS